MTNELIMVIKQKVLLFLSVGRYHCALCRHMSAHDKSSIVHSFIGRLRDSFEKGTRVGLSVEPG